MTQTTATTDPSKARRAAAAKSAYLAYIAATHRAERRPTNLSLASALKKYAVDPALAMEGNHLFGYRNSGIAWRGTPPKPRVSVQSIKTAGVPYPTVTLTDCPTVSSSWTPYLVKTKKSVPITYPKGSAKSPHGIMVKIIYYHSKWFVQSTKTNVKKTCTP